MVIEAIINGEILTRYEIPDEYLQDIEGAGWQRNVEFREQIIGMYLEAFIKKMEKFFHPGFQVDYRLVFPSKMDMLNEKDLIGPGESNQISDQRAETGDPGHAGRTLREHDGLLPATDVTRSGDPRYSGA